ncbi:MAG: zf-HC2 domain-containing protein [Gemmatimonadaceae bacterium]|nr:zf-HC2 domain-containing protein [Gemmatimonadaceae bacterium]
MTHSMIACEEAQRLASERLDGALAAAQAALLDAHLAACADCRAVATDLARLRTATARLPALTPSRDLWDGIAARLATPVVPLRATRATRMRPSVRRLAAAAVIMVAATAGGTWMIATRSANRMSQPVAGPRLRPQLVAVADQKGIAAYEDAIAHLRDIVARRRGDLDAKTIAVLDTNLKVIDHAIAECAAALAADPASTVLAEQLNRVYDAKLALLRSAALLPSHT